MKKISVFEINSFKKIGTSDPKWQNTGIFIVLITILTSLVVLTANAFKLTIVQGEEYSNFAAHNTLEKTAIWGERGIITDRNGTQLVSNEKSYEIFVNPALIKIEDALHFLPNSDERLNEIYSNPEYVDYLVMHKAEKEVVVKIKENKPEGIIIQYNYSRNYLYGKYFAHIIGYTGIASASELESGYAKLQNQLVGKTGLELQYEDEIRGELSYITYEKDAFGNEIASSFLSPPKQGRNMTLTFDLKSQKSLYAALQTTVKARKAKGGSAVILDISTGEVIALASYPSFDPNKFVSGISYKDYEKLISNPQTPLLFRAIAAQEPPGSTFKVIVGSAALQENAISDKTIINAPGVITLSGGFPFQDYKKRVNGNLTIKEALMVSSNIFFCKTSLKLGIDKFVTYSDKFGIGTKSGIDLPGEMPGRVPSPANKIALARNGATWLDDVWYPEGDTCNSAIGQGIALATPLQMANVAAIIANGGAYYKPFVVKTIGNGDNLFIRKPTMIRDNIIEDKNLKVIREGMRMSVAGSRGVATALRYVPIKVAAKTGTAEFGVKDKHGYSTAHGWVIGFYPYDNPKYAFAMLIEGAGTSSAATFGMRDFLNRIY